MRIGEKTIAWNVIALLGPTVRLRTYPGMADHYDNNWNRPALVQVTPLELTATVPRNWRSLRGPPELALMLQVLALMLWVLALLALML